MRLTGIGESPERVELAFTGATWIAADVLRAADVTAFRRHVGALGAIAARTALPLHRWYATVHEAQLATIEGRVGRARTLVESAATLGGRLGIPLAEAYRAGQLAVLARADEGLALHVDEFGDVARRFPHFATMTALHALAMVEAGAARDAGRRSRSTS